MSALDTSTLGRICDDRAATAARAKVVRDALKLIARETTAGQTMTSSLMLATADDETLAKLGRLVR